MTTPPPPFRDPVAADVFPLAECRSCGRSIVWTIYAKTGNRLPVDLDPPDPMAPNLRVRVAGDGTLASFFHRAETGDVCGRWKLTLGVSHHATCPHGRAWRRGRA